MSFLQHGVSMMVSVLALALICFALTLGLGELIVANKQKLANIY
jgi:hypothetical protein